MKDLDEVLFAFYETFVSHFCLSSFSALYYVTTLTNSSVALYIAFVYLIIRCAFQG